MENPRPTFLTVLCILTFVWSIFSIYSVIINYTSADMASGITRDLMDEARDKIEAEAGDEPGSEVAGKIMDSMSANMSVDKIKNNAVASGIANILALVGAILMWGLNKKGFWIYILGAVVSIIAPLFIFDGFMGAISSAGMAFFSIIFAVMYYLNLKHLH